jgi:hypothetical protein
MPIVPIVKTMPPMSLDRIGALRVNCEHLYIALIKQVGTQDVDIEVQPGITRNGEWIPYGSIRVPREPIILANLFSDRYLECKVLVRYTYGLSGLDPNEKLTRLEFVMQTLDIWDRLYTGAQRQSFKAQSETETQMTAAMEILKSTYSFQELMQPGLDMDTFKAMFEADKENSDGTIA